MHQLTAPKARTSAVQIACAFTCSKRRLLSAALPFVLFGCAAVGLVSMSHAATDGSSAAPVKAAAAKATDAISTAENSSLLEMELDDDRGQLMFEILIAELAGRRGAMDIAAEGYLRASKRTTDVRVAERATKLSVWSRDWATAELAVVRWLELDDALAEPNELYAQILLRSNRPAEAAAQFAKIVEMHATPELMMSEVSLLLAREPEQPRAKQTMLMLQERFPQLVESHLGIARFALQSDDTASALLAVKRALEVDALHGEALLLQSQILLAQGKAVHNLPQLAKAVENDRDNLSLRMGYAKLLIDVGQGEPAATELQTLFGLAPGNANVLLTIGLLALDIEQSDMAKTYFEALQSTGEHGDQANFYLARIYDQEGNYASAISQYEAVAEGDLYFSARLRAAELYAFSGQMNTGLERLRSLSRRVEDPSIKASIVGSEGRILQNAGEKLRAFEVLSEGLEQYPESGELLYARALAAEGIGEMDLLQSDLKKLIRLQPNNASALNALGYFLADQNTLLEEAEIYLEKAIALRPNDPAILDSIGWLRFRQGKLDEALALLQQAYEQFPDGEIAAHLGEVLWMQGQIEQARAMWQGALEVAPTDKKVLETQARLDR